MGDPEFARSTVFEQQHAKEIATVREALLDRCPKPSCRRFVIDWEGCAAVSCIHNERKQDDDSCNTGSYDHCFCGVCFNVVTNGMAEMHTHVSQCSKRHGLQKNLFPSPSDYARLRTERRAKRVRDAFNAIAQSKRRAVAEYFANSKDTAKEFEVFRTAEFKRLFLS